MAHSSSKYGTFPTSVDNRAKIHPLTERRLNRKVLRILLLSTIFVATIVVTAIIRSAPLVLRLHGLSISIDLDYRNSWQIPIIIVSSGCSVLGYSAAYVTGGVIGGASCNIALHFADVVFSSAIDVHKTSDENILIRELEYSYRNQMRPEPNKLQGNINNEKFSDSIEYLI